MSEQQDGRIPVCCSGGESWVSQRDKGGKHKGLKKEMGGKVGEESFRQVYLSTRRGGVGSRQLELRIKR